MKVSSKKIEYSQTENNRLWLVISSTKIGGAERRILNLATQAVHLRPNLVVNFLITPRLYSKYCDDTQLSLLLNNNKIKIHLIDWPTSDPFLIKSIVSPLSKSLQKGINLLQRFTNYSNRLLPNHTLEKPHGYDPQEFFKLRQFSWYQKMLLYTRPGDHVHCFAGSIERNGGVLLSQQKRMVTLEITSNRILEQVISELKCILFKIGPCPNLHIQSVSETVHQNFVSGIGANFLKDYQISYDFYKTACLPLDTATPNTPVERENIIIFAHRFVGPKNGILFAQVISDIYQQGELKNWEIYFLGFGPEEAAIQNILGELVAGGTAKIGWSTDLESELNRAKIFVSIIETGSYPSQSVFQAMRNGNLLILGDVGETRERFAHQDIYFTNIEKTAITEVLLSAMADAENSTVFKAKSRAMKKFFQMFSEKSSQAKELLSLHFYDELRC